MSCKTVSYKNIMALKLFFKSHYDFKNKTPDMPNKGFSHRMLHGGGSDLQYGLRQAEYFMQFKIGRN